jgi:ribokinase
MKKILVVGSLNMDLVTELNRTPKVGETTIGGNIVKIPGGKGANQCAAMARLGADVAMIGRVGKDEYGDILIDTLKEFGAKTDGIKKDEKVDTGLAFIMVNADGDNSIVVIPGANFSLVKEDISRDMVEECDFVVAQFETPLEIVKEVFRVSKELGKKNVLNPAPAKEIDDEMISLVDILVPNETELEILTAIKIDGMDDIDRGAKALLDKGVEEVIVTLGKDGSKYYSKDKTIKVDGKVVKAVDTTAAGDSYIGGLIYSLSKGMEIEEAMNYATMVSALTVTKKGAQSSLPSAKEIKDYFNL